MPLPCFAMRRHPAPPADFFSKFDPLARIIPLPVAEPLPRAPKGVPRRLWCSFVLCRVDLSDLSVARGEGVLLGVVRF